jgi:hypothetical protein
MNHRHHSAHTATQSPSPSEGAPAAGAAAVLDPESERVRYLLEELDDAIFQAVRGDQRAMKTAHELWPQVVAELGFDLVEESREQYLRYANDLIRCVEVERMNDPRLTLAALEIVELLTH